VAFREAAEPSFVEYQRRVLANARRMCEVFTERGVEVWTGGTDSHMVMLDLARRGLEGAAVAAALAEAQILVNAIRIPGAYDEGAAGLRLGTPALTTRGMGLDEAGRAAHLVADVVAEPRKAAVLERVRRGVEDLCREFPVYSGPRS
jgi:glycine hydroxymethyltransferase